MRKQYLKCTNCGEELKVNKAQTGRVAKRRGNAFELAVARYLSKKTGRVFKRTPASGAMAEFKGDILPIGFQLPFLIECKNREDIHLLKILKNPDYIKDLVNGKQVLIFNQGEAIAVVHQSLGPFQGGFRVTIGEQPYAILQIKDFIPVLQDCLYA